MVCQNITSVRIRNGNIQSCFLGYGGLTEEQIADGLQMIDAILKENE